MSDEVTLAFNDTQWHEITATLNDTRETAAVLLAGQAETSQGLLLTVNRVLWVPEEAYDKRTDRELEIRSAGWMPALREASDGRWLPILMHTHPNQSAAASQRDDGVDARLAESVRIRVGVDRYVSLIIGGSPSGPTFTGRVYEQSRAPIPIARLRVAGKQFRIQTAEDNPAAAPSPAIFDRQIRAFGTEGQQVLSQVRAGVVGCGGTGSAVLEQLLRLGVGSLTFIDFDHVTETNVTRIYGSTLSDVKRSKVEVVFGHLASIGFPASLRPIFGSVTDRETMEELRGCDVVFGCTDDDGGRAVLSRLAYWYLLPVIDMGVLISSQEGRIGGVFGRTTFAAPGEPCLLCRGEIDPNRAREQHYSSAERRALVDEGYAQGLTERDPAVIAYTSMVASFAVSEMLQRLFGFGAPPPGKQLIQISDRVIRRQAGQSRDGCYCTTPNKWGRADSRSALGLTWAA